MSSRVRGFWIGPAVAVATILEYVIAVVKGVYLN
jgi:hypothetical protein